MSSLHVGRNKRYLWPWLLPVFVWCAVLSWRPWFLGFYHDDWMTLQPLTSSEAVKVLLDQISRPVYGLSLVLLRGVLPFDPFYWQFALAFLIAGSAVFIGFFARTLARTVADDDRVATWAGAFSACAWIAMPWNLGISAWPTTFAAQISIMGFCLIGQYVLGADALGKKMCKALSVFILISLISELFWMAFVPLILMHLYRQKALRFRDRLKEAAYLFGGFCVAQFLLLLFNRLLVYVGVGVNRSLNGAWFDTSWQSIKLMPTEIQSAVLWPDMFFALIWISLALLLIGAALRKNVFLYACVVAIVGGCMISILLFAFAGYRIQALGVFSRTTTAISFWLSLLPALIIAIAAQFHRYVLQAVSILMLLLVGFLSASSVQNTQAWRKSWEFEQQVFKAFPGKTLAGNAAPESFVLVDASRPKDTVEGLEAYWDVSGALLATHPELGERFSSSEHRYFASMLNAENFRTTWDGKELVQSWCHTPGVAVWKLKAPSDLYLWRKSDGTLSKLSAPVQLGCGHS